MLKCIITLYEESQRAIADSPAEKKVTWSFIKSSLAKVIQKVTEAKFVVRRNEYIVLLWCCVNLTSGEIGSQVADCDDQRYLRCPCEGDRERLLDINGRVKIQTRLCGRGNICDTRVDRYEGLVRVGVWAKMNEIRCGTVGERILVYIGPQILFCGEMLAEIESEPKKLIAF